MKEIKEIKIEKESVIESITDDILANVITRNELVEQIGRMKKRAEKLFDLLTKNLINEGLIDKDEFPLKINHEKHIIKVGYLSGWEGEV